MCRSVCGSWRMDAGGQTEHDGIQYCHRCGSVSNQIHPWHNWPCRRHHHRQVSSGHQSGIEIVESRRCTSRWGPQCGCQLGVRCLSTVLPHVASVETSVGDFERRRMVCDQNFPFERLHVAVVDFQTTV
uniref:Uncharacterized protein n=1 Tax=Cacopsylla melanoneura TaxID=428564 RepID=A0A8D8W3D6_9HEMI